MTTEPTPGPYFIDDTKRNGIYIRTEARTHPGATKGVAVGQAPHGAVGYGEAMANAKLFAAAPDMLAALQDAETEIENLLDDLTSEPDQDISANKTLSTIRAAITRALGKTEPTTASLAQVEGEPNAIPR